MGTDGEYAVGPGGRRGGDAAEGLSRPVKADDFFAPEEELSIAVVLGVCMGECWYEVRVEPYLRLSFIRRSFQVNSTGSWSSYSSIKS